MPFLLNQWRKIILLVSAHTQKAGEGESKIKNEEEEDCCLSGLWKETEVKSDWWPKAINEACLGSKGLTTPTAENAFFPYFLFVFLKSLVGDIKEWPNEQNDKKRCVCTL